MFGFWLQLAKLAQQIQLAELAKLTVFGLVWFKLANLTKMDELVRLDEMAKLAKIG